MSDDLDDESQWHEWLTMAVKHAAEHIHALPPELRARALAMLVACFDRELKPLATYRRRYRGRS